MANFFSISVADHLADAASASTTDELLECVRLLRPQPCPFRLIRYGNDGDGGYLLPDDLAGITDCFSPGVENRKDFEDALLSLHGISSHLCDASSDPANFLTALHPTRQTFQKKWLDASGEDNCISLDDWVSQFASPVGDLILQMDIEGAEYRNLLGCRENTLRRFRIIVVELHGLHRLQEPAVLKTVIRPFLQKLNLNFTCIHAHPNNCCPAIAVGDGRTFMPSVLELTLIRNDRFKVNDNRLAVTIPHPGDRTCVVGQKPIFLCGEWLAARTRPLSARRRIFCDIAVYLAHRTRRLIPSIKRRFAKKIQANYQVQAK